MRLRIGFSAELGERLTIGASLAVEGVCLTVVELASTSCEVELSPETLARTRLGALDAGQAVNLEPALRLGDPLGGHWVQGHVDGTVEVLARRDLEAHRELIFSLPSEHLAGFVEKGSVTLDGVSLTVASLDDERFSVALIPHTLQATTLGERVVGDRVHLEIDVLAKYIQRALELRGQGR